MTTKTDITLLPCPCCGAPAVTGADAEYENSNGEPAVECSSCNVMSWTVEDWNRRAAVEADRAQMNDNARCISKLAESDKQDHSGGVTEMVEDHVEGVRHMVPSDEIDIADVRQYLNQWGCLAHPGVRALLSRYGSGQPALESAASAEPIHEDVLGRLYTGKATSGDQMLAWQALQPVPVAQEPVTPKRITAPTMVDLKAAIYAHHGWARAAGESMSARIGELYDVAPDHKAGRFVATPKSVPVAQEPVIKEETSHEN